MISIFIDRDSGGKSDSADNLLDAIFPDGYEGVADGISTNPRFLPEGYIHVFDMDE